MIGNIYKYARDEDVPDSTGTHILYESVSAVVGNVRASKCVDKDWSDELNKDYICRVKNNR